MKAINHIEQNRPVHLAMRDAYYDHARAKIRALKNLAAQELGTTDYREILFMLRTARDHGRFAVRNDRKNEKDGQFCAFINMLVGNVKTVLSMLDLKRSVEAEDGFFFSFLEANYASVSLQAEEYERRARDIIRCMLNTLDLANDAYEGLKQANRAEFDASDSARYDKARAHYEGLIAKSPELLLYKRAPDWLPNRD